MLTKGEGRISTVELLVLTSPDQLLFILKIFDYFFYKTTYLKVEVNRYESFPPVRLPCLSFAMSSTLRFVSLNLFSPNFQLLSCAVLGLSIWILADQPSFMNVLDQVSVNYPVYTSAAVVLLVLSILVPASYNFLLRY